jgi:hypothetical protein
MLNSNPSKKIQNKLPKKVIGRKPLQIEIKVKNFYVNFSLINFFAKALTKFITPITVSLRLANHSFTNTWSVNMYKEPQNIVE